MSKPYQLSAVEARELIGEKRLSPVELVDSCIDRIEEVNPVVNAFVATCYEWARAEAMEAERSRSKGKNTSRVSAAGLRLLEIRMEG